MEPNVLYLVGGIAVLTITLFRLYIKRKRREVENRTRRHAAAQTAKAEQDKLMRKMGKPVKAQPSSRQSTQTGRIPLADAVGTIFTGSAIPSSIARWETEVHELGRQIMGKIDSKMVALQTLTLEANRAANRMELLLERFEEIVKQQTPTKSTQPLAIEPAPMLTEPPVQNVLPADQNAELASYTVILNDLESEIDHLSTDSVFGLEAAAPVTVLKPESVPDSTANSSIANSLPLSPPSLPGEKSVSLPVKLLYEDNLTSQPAAVAGSPLDLRKQVEMMSDYGYSPRQIAQSLNITQGEVDLMLSLRG